ARRVRPGRRRDRAPRPEGRDPRALGRDVPAPPEARPGHGAGDPLGVAPHRPLRSGLDGAAGGGQLGDRADPRLVGAALLLAPRRRLGREPAIELRAAVAVRDRRLRAAVGVSLRAGHADVEVLVVAPPGADLAQPGAVAARRLAQRLLEHRVDEDALDPRIGGGELEEPALAAAPRAGRAGALVIDHPDLPHALLSLDERVPDVGVEPGLVARVAARRRAAARLRQIAEGDRAELLAPGRA